MYAGHVSPSPRQGGHPGTEDRARLEMTGHPPDAYIGRPVRHRGAAEDAETTPAVEARQPGGGQPEGRRAARRRRSRQPRAVIGESGGSRAGPSGARKHRNRRKHGKRAGSGAHREAREKGRRSTRRPRGCTRFSVVGPEVPGLFPEGSDAGMRIRAKVSGSAAWPVRRLCGRTECRLFP